MSTIPKVCPQCGLPLKVGLANCGYCGAQVGTVFDPGAAPVEDSKAKVRKRVRTHLDYYQKVEKAQEQANNSVILGLLGFIPLIGFVTGGVAIALAVAALKALKANQIEEGQGSAIAGVIIGIIAIIAQICIVIWIVKNGTPF
jgi:hypothetical protein